MKFDWKTEYYRYHRYFFDLQKKAKTTQVRSFAWLSLTIFTVCFFIIVAIRPTLVTIAKLNKEIKDQKEASGQLQAKIDSIIAAQQEFTANIDNLDLLEQALPKNNEFPSLSNFFEEVAANGNVTLESLNFEKITTLKDTSKTPAQNTPDSLNFSLGVSGSYLQLNEFLSTVQLSRRILKIKRASFGQVKKENNFELLLIISGTAFFNNTQ